MDWREGAVLVASALGVLATAAAAIVVSAWLWQSPPHVVGAVGVLSSCGVHAVATVDSNGEVTLYSAERLAGPEIVEAVDNLPEDKRHIVIVPTE